MADWVIATQLGKLQPHGRALARLPGVEVALFQVDGQVHAIEDSCPHAGASLCLGSLNGHQVQCRAHGLKFDLRTGVMPGGGLKAKVFPVRIVGDDVQIQQASA